MRQNPPKPKLPRKLSAAMDLGPDGVGRVETDPHGPRILPKKSPSSPNRAGRRGCKPGRQPTAEPTYAVGFGRPPKHTKFKPGQSGNPKGRSPQSRNFKTMVNKVLGEQVEIREGRKIRRMPKIEALFRTTMSRAFKGDPKAMASLIVMMKHSGYGAEAAESGRNCCRVWTTKESSRSTWSAWGSQIQQCHSSPDELNRKRPVRPKRGKHDHGACPFRRFPQP